MENRKVANRESECNPVIEGQKHKNGGEKMKKLNLVGQRYGKLVVVENAGVKNGRSYSYCDCDCGKKHILIMNKQLRNGHTKSCGCYKAEVISKIGKQTGSTNIIKAHKVAWEQNKTHGASKTRLYRIWEGMKQRCYNPNSDAYIFYGGKGIEFYEEWKNFSVFQEWALSHGYEEELSIDRIKPENGYSPENCRWVTSSFNSQRAGEEYKLYILTNNKTGEQFQTNNLTKFCKEHELGHSVYYFVDLLRGKIKPKDWTIVKINPSIQSTIERVE